MGVTLETKNGKKRRFKGKEWKGIQMGEDREKGREEKARRGRNDKYRGSKEEGRNKGLEKEVVEIKTQMKEKGKRRN